MTAREKIQAEYDRCAHLYSNPQMSTPELFGVKTLEEIRRYYEYRTEALGFALDKMAQEDRGES